MSFELEAAVFKEVNAQPQVGQAHLQKAAVGALPKRNGRPEGSGSILVGGFHQFEKAVRVYQMRMNGEPSHQERQNP